MGSKSSKPKNGNNNNNNAKHNGSPQLKRPARGASVSTVNDRDRAKLQLKLQRDKLTSSMNRLDIVADNEALKAKEFVRSGKKERAVICLKRMKALRRQQENVVAHHRNILTLLDTIEFKEIELEVREALKGGTHELQKLNSALSDVESIVDDAAEVISEAREVDILLAEFLGDPELVQDAEEELAKLELGTEGKTKTATSSKDDQQAILEDVKVPTHAVAEKKENDSIKTTTEEGVAEEPEEQDGESELVAA